MVGKGIALALMVGLVTGCSNSSEIDRPRCRFERVQGMCEASVTLEPRESDSPNEATTLEVRWRWSTPSDIEVPDRVVRTHLTAREARALAEAIDELGRSRCSIEQPIDVTDDCDATTRIADIEAQP